eukprot:CAMPEP_0185769088 /NCGR_PEP_ID=MMETSP1174-20130828/53362_1 /TAXON_ID=35687 /ORGANISM="Dictyocha speculum, Strain CCMP1381" /LENGTH=243 /DNA_ID=CAMNT_0028454039 /DNA_START=14 /DNA_END=745 /DNA_ORIENTATION=+
MVLNGKDSEPKCTPPDSLVKYETPLYVGFDPSSGETGDSTWKKPSSNQLDDMVNSILPPREWTEESGTWMQYVSKQPATRLDVASLQQELDEKIAARQARDKGLCLVREDLYTQCFNETIRQVTLESPEHGLLLLRVRDELKMTIDAHKLLCASSDTFGVRKLLQAEQGMSELESQIETLETERKELENQVTQLRNRVELTEKRAVERQIQAERAQRSEEIEFLKGQGRHFDTIIRQLNGGKG